MQISLIVGTDEEAGENTMPPDVQSLCQFDDSSARLARAGAV